MLVGRGASLPRRASAVNKESDDLVAMREESGESSRGVRRKGRDYCRKGRPESTLLEIIPRYVCGGLATLCDGRWIYTEYSLSDVHRTVCVAHILPPIWQKDDRLFSFLVP